MAKDQNFISVNNLGYSKASIKKNLAYNANDAITTKFSNAEWNIDEDVFKKKLFKKFSNSFKEKK